jgi:hypothetical protein
MEQPLFLDEIAHIIVTDRLGTVGALKKAGVLTDENVDDEKLFRLIIEHRKKNQALSDDLFSVLRKCPPLERHCVHCLDHIQSAFAVGMKVYNEICKK